MYVTEQQLKVQLQREDTVISKELLDQMLHHIGSLDPILRDDLIFSRLAEWIMSGELPVTSAKRIVSFVLSPDGLFYKMKTSDDTAVFTRSFSALLLAVVLEKDAVSEQRNRFSGTGTLLRLGPQHCPYCGCVPGLVGSSPLSSGATTAGNRPLYRNFDNACISFHR